MDNYNEQEQDELNPKEVNLIVTEDIRSYIYETAKWAKFLSIVGFFLTVWMVMASFSAPVLESALSQTPGGKPMAELGSTVLMILFLVIALIYFYPSLMLFKYASAAKNAVLYEEQESLSTAMSKMKSFFKFWAILTITIMVFYGLAILATMYSIQSA